MKKKENNSAASENMKAVGKAFEIKTTTNLDPKKYFVDGKGLFVWNSFIDRISSAADSVKKGKKFNVQAHDLIKSSTDERIEGSLPKKHLFSVTEVSAIVSTLIEKQRSGEKGILVTNGYANLFYTPSWVVCVYWFSGSREWSVGTWFRDDYRWDADSRVFSPATDL